MGPGSTLHAELIQEYTKYSTCSSCVNCQLISQDLQDNIHDRGFEFELWTEKRNKESGETSAVIWTRSHRNFRPASGFGLHPDNNGMPVKGCKQKSIIIRFASLKRSV